MKEIIKIQTFDGKIFDNTKQAEKHLHAVIEEKIGVLIIDKMYKKLGANVRSKLDVYEFIYNNLEVFAMANEIKKDIINIEEIE